MPSDFTVIQQVRQHFGDERAEEYRVEKQAPYVGPAKDFPFSCPDVNGSEAGILQFETRGVTAGYFDEFPRNILRVNGIDIPGGITPGPWFRVVADTQNLPLWKSHSLVVPANVLREQNVLHIEAVPLPVFGPTNLDNFIIDNIVVFFKTRRGGAVGPSTPPLIAKKTSKQAGSRRASKR